MKYDVIWRNMEKRSHRKKKKDPAKLIGNATIAVGAATTGLATSRAIFQSQVDPKLVSVSGGSSNKLIKLPQKPRYSTVFDAQRDGWVQAFQGAGYKTKSYSPYSNHYTISKGLPIPLSTRVDARRKNKTEVSALNIDVGSSIAAEQKAWFGRVFKGTPHYRAFSDFGKGNQTQPRRDPLMKQKNTMWASSGDFYTRNLVPGDSMIPGAVAAARDNIDMPNIPSSSAGMPVGKFKGRRKGKELVSLSFGSGHHWADDRFPNKDKNIGAIIEGLDRVYGKKKYDLHIVGGKNISGEFKHFFKGVAKKRRGWKFYESGMAQKDYLNLLSDSKIAITGPGSTIGELSQLKGRKPRVLGLDPNSVIDTNFNPNMKWYKRHFGVGETLDTGFKVTSADEAETAIRKLLATKRTSRGNEPVRIENKHMQHVMDTAAFDLSKSKRLTKNLMRGGIGAIALGGVALGVSHIQKNGLPKIFEKKGALKYLNEDYKKEIIAPTAIAGTTYAGHSILTTRASVKNYYKSFQEVEKDYSAAKRGDVFFLQNTIMKGKTHPILITEGEGMNAKFMEINPFVQSKEKGSLHSGMLRDKLHDTMHITNKKGEKVFFAKGTKHLGGIGRDPNLNEAKFDKVVYDLKNTPNQKFKYSIIANKTNLKSCNVKGQCVTFADEVLQQSSNNPRTTTPFPDKFSQQLNEVVAPRFKVSGKVAPLTLAAGAVGATKMFKGFSEGDERKKLVGSAALGTAGLLALSPKVRQITSVGVQFPMQAAGEAALQIGAKTKDSLIGNTNYKSEIEMGNFVKKHRWVPKALGATMLVPPIAYGIHKGIERYENRK